MIVLGLTGSIGMGKSTVASMFEAAGVPVFDADAVVRRLQGPGGRLLPAIEAMFPGMTSEAGIDRGRIGEAVFFDPPSLRRLEALIHPAVAEERAAFLELNREAPLVVLDIPLLFETGGEEKMDRIAVVSAPPEVQRERVLARPGMTAARFESILAFQLPDAEKRARADFVIDTGGPIEATRDQVNAVIACLGGGAGG